MQSSPRIDELRQKFHENPRRYFAPLANEYRKAGDPEQAIAICRAHLAQQPAHMSGHVVYGQALYDARQIDEARVVFEKALALDPDNVVVLRHLGDIARQRGDSAEARHWYKRALDNEPYDAEIAAYVAELTEPVTVTEAAKPQPDLEIEEVGAEVASSEPAADTSAAETSQDTVAPEGSPELEMVGHARELDVAEVAPDLEIAEVAPVSDVIDLPITPAPCQPIPTFRGESHLWRRRRPSLRERWASSTQSRVTTRLLSMCSVSLPFATLKTAG